LPEEGNAHTAFHFSDRSSACRALEAFTADDAESDDERDVQQMRAMTSRGA
jgi:hypothetical protein